MRSHPALLLLVASCAPCLAQETIGPGLSGAALRQHLRTNYAPTAILSYRDARRHMFETIDDLDGDNDLVCVYTGTPFHTVSIPDPNDVNCEHTWPQSRFNGPGMKSDIHHLYCTFSVSNATRGNKPFGEIDDADADDWCGPGNDRSDSPPEESIDEFSESTATHFEPREAHKGNVARSMFYFATIYENRNIQRSWFEDQLPTLLSWHELDPVDQAERDRSTAVAGVQGNRNPFVHDPTLVQRIFGNGQGDAGGDMTDEPPPAGEEPEPDAEPAPPQATGAVKILALLPNPEGADEGHERVILANESSAAVDLADWAMRDASGNRHALSGTIDANGVLRITLPAGEMPLNNSGGDTIELLDPSGNVMHRISYTASQARPNAFVTFP